MTQIRLAEERGHLKNHWLDTYHTFSFNSYYDSRYMGFSSLRVINDDTIQPGQGFGTHPHNDMEIVTYVLEGELEHKDSMGNGSVIKAGDVQRMSAGTGILHSEFNPSKQHPAHFLQIWIRPAEKDVKPSYQQTSFSRDQKLGRWKLIVSPNGADDSLRIGQDAKIYSSILDEGQEATMRFDAERNMWLQIAHGDVVMDGRKLRAGDGVSIRKPTEVTIKSLHETEALLFDLD